MQVAMDRGVIRHGCFQGFESGFRYVGGWHDFFPEPFYDGNASSKRTSCGIRYKALQHPRRIILDLFTLTLH
jgi:hypothetical protein